MTSTKARALMLFMRTTFRLLATRSATSLLAALGLVPAAACGGSVDEASGGGSTQSATGPTAPPTCEELTAGVTVVTSAALGVTTGGGAGGDGGGGAVGPVACNTYDPVLIGCLDSGVDQCEGGFLRRRAAVACPAWHRTDRTCAYNSDQYAPEEQCGRDSDCGLGNLCESRFYGPPTGDVCSCQQGCRTDDDCTTDQLCLCGEGQGRCVTANCRTDADCGPGRHCASSEIGGCTPGVAFHCQTDSDECSTAADCLMDDMGQQGCEADAQGIRRCVSNGCMATGRPLVVDGHVVCADVVRREDWHANVAGAANALPEDLRSAVLGGWTEIARMEHASVASFARFALDLMAHGAPPALLAGAAKAMQDEISHAELAFAMVARLGGPGADPLGPGPLPLTGGAGAATIAELAVATLLEGCVAEGVAALEAGIARDAAVDSEIARVLAQIAREEAQHAELAWRTIQWALELDVASVAPALAAALNDADRAHVSPVSPGEAPDLLAWGLMGGADRAALRREVLRHVVRPVLARLVDATTRVSKPAARPAAARARAPEWG